MSIESNDPLVSVAVITYNNSQYVIETLESIKSQSYPNLDLIISDDSSQDKTIEIVRDWISQTENKQRFKRIELITVPQNTGIPANCNRAIAMAESKWIKFSAGDDILLPNCIEDNIKFVNKHPEALAIFSQVKVYENTFEEKNFTKLTPDEFPNNLMDPGITSSDQYELLLLSDRITYTPSYFFNKQAVLNVGGYDEAIRLVEDYPMWLKLTSAGEKLYYFHKPTVGYRIHQQAINNRGEDVLFKPSVIYNYAIRKKYAHPHLPWLIRADESWKYRVTNIFKALGWSKNTAILCWWYAMCTFYLNPFIYLKAISKRLSIKK